MAGTQAAGISRDELLSIIDQIAKGAVLEQIAVRGTRKRFYPAIHADPELALLYGRAQAARVDLIIAKATEEAEGEPDPEKRRRKIDAAKWYASSLRPKKFGDQVEPKKLKGKPGMKSMAGSLATVIAGA